MTIIKKRSILEAIGGYAVARVALISDIHANIQALERVLREIEKRNVDVIRCLGDITGYGGNPDEAVTRIRETCATVIMGNHDKVVAGLDDGAHFNGYAKAAVDAHRTLLSDANREWLLSLPDAYTNEHDIFVHGALSDPERYLFDEYTLESELLLLEKEGYHALFCGHTHIATFANKKKRTLIATPKRLDIGEDVAIVNPGSVGQPRDDNPHAAFAIFDTSLREVRFLRVPYDVNAAAHAIRTRGLPEFLAERITRGQ